MVDRSVSGNEKRGDSLKSGVPGDGQEAGEKGCGQGQGQLAAASDLTKHRPRDLELPCGG